MFRTLLALLTIHTVACGTDNNQGEPGVFPADYAQTYQQVRGCRFSIEHNLVHIRVLASPDALVPYMGRTRPFPTGSIVLKEQYGEDDTTCAGPIETFTVMQKLDVGSAPETLDWTWQEVNRAIEVLPTSVKRCVDCHTDCGTAPEGYDGTCTLP